MAPTFISKNTWYKKYYAEILPFELLQDDKHQIHKFDHDIVFLCDESNWWERVECL